MTGNLKENEHPTIFLLETVTLKSCYHEGIEPPAGYLIFEEGLRFHKSPRLSIWEMWTTNNENKGEEYYTLVRARGRIELRITRLLHDSKEKQGLDRVAWSSE